MSEVLANATAFFEDFFDGRPYGCYFCVEAKIAVDTRSQLPQGFMHGPSRREGFMRVGCEVSPGAYARRFKLKLLGGALLQSLQSVE